MSAYPTCPQKGALKRLSRGLRFVVSRDLSWPIVFGIGGLLQSSLVPAESDAGGASSERSNAYAKRTSELRAFGPAELDGGVSDAA